MSDNIDFMYKDLAAQLAIVGADTAHEIQTASFVITPAGSKNVELVGW